MRKFLFGLTVLMLCVIVVLFLTNPSTQDFKEFYEFQHSINVSQTYGDTRVSIGRTKNYLIFSIFEAKWRRVPQSDSFLKSLDPIKLPPSQPDLPTETYVGIVGNFYLRGVELN